MRAYYMGCRNGSKGHFLQAPPGGRMISSESEHKLMGGYPNWTGGQIPFGCLDSKRMYPSHEREGVAKLQHKDGWTALGFADRSVDSRPGSHSTFVFDRTLDFDEAAAEAERQFPAIWQRFNFEVILDTAGAGT